MKVLNVGVLSEAYLARTGGNPDVNFSRIAFSDPRERVLSKLAEVDAVTMTNMAVCLFARTVFCAGKIQYKIFGESLQEVGHEIYFEREYQPTKAEIDLALSTPVNILVNRQEETLRQMEILSNLVRAAFPDAMLVITLSEGIIKKPMEFKFPKELK